MSIANVNMFEFENEEALKTFANWYNGNGADDYMKYADCEIILDSEGITPIVKF